jgi:hypothetical protein
VTEWADVFSVTPNLFDLLGVRAVAGRTSADPERQTEPDRVAILTEGFWRRVFGGDPAIVGKRIRLAGGDAPGADDSYEVLGIVPWRVDLSYRRPLRVHVFIPHTLSPEERRDERRRVPGLLTFGRLKADVSAARNHRWLRWPRTSRAGRRAWARRR